MGFFDIESGPSARFNAVGDSITGRITKPYRETQATEFGTDRPKVDEQGNPVKMAIIELDTGKIDPTIPNHDGCWLIYVEKVGQKIAVAKAIQAAGARDLEPGGTLTITYTGDTPSTKGNPLKNWGATYVPPAPSFAGVSSTPTTTVGNGYANGGVVSAPANGAAATANGNGGDMNDLVAAARAAQQKAQTDQAAMAAKTAAASEPAPAANGAGDIPKIRELAKLGFGPAEIQAAMPQFGMDAITAVLAI